MATVLIYINRKINPAECLNIIWHLNDNWLNLTPNHVDQLNSLRAYMVTYVRQSMYRYLNSYIEHNYRAYSSFMQSTRLEEWISTLLDEVLKWPGFEVINEKLKDVYSYIQSKKEHKKMLQVLEEKTASK